MDPRQFIPGFFSFELDPGEKPIVPSYDIPSLPKSFTITIPPIPIPPIPTLPKIPAPAVLVKILKPYIPPVPKLPEIPKAPTVTVEVKKG